MEICNAAACLRDQVAVHELSNNPEWCPGLSGSTAEHVEGTEARGCENSDIVKKGIAEVASVEAAGNIGDPLMP